MSGDTGIRYQSDFKKIYLDLEYLLESKVNRLSINSEEDEKENEFDVSKDDSIRNKLIFLFKHFLSEIDSKSNSVYIQEPMVKSRRRRSTAARNANGVFLKKLYERNTHFTKETNNAIENDFLFDISYHVFGECKLFPVFSKQPLFMVTRCPMDFHNYKIISLCHETDLKTLDKCVINMENIPVEDIRGIVYKNYYCAVCHRAQNVTSWTADLETSDISVLKVVDGLHSVNIMENLGYISNCTQRIYPYHQHNIRHCHKVDKQKTRIHMSRDLHPDFETPTKSTDFLLSFQIFINFGINGKGHMIFSTEPVSSPDTENHNCLSNQVFYKGSCREVTCDEGYHFEDNNCRPDEQTLYEDPKEAGKAISKLKYMTDLRKVTLRLNVTRDDLILLDQKGADDVVEENLAKLLNVSISRIRNLTLECDTGVSKGHVLEIRPISESQDEDHLNEFNFTAIGQSETIEDYFVKENTSKEETIYVNQMLEKYGNDNLNCDINSQNPYDLYNTDIFTIAIHFELVGGRKKSSNYVSAQKVADRIKDLIKSQSFNLNLNGTELRVTEYTDNSNTTHLDTWCVHGQQEMKDGNDVDVRIFRDTRTGKMVKGIYVNSTDRYYGPDMFDLYVMVSGEIGSITNVTTLAFVYVCNEPRIDTNKCAKITATAHDYILFADNNSILFENEVFNMSQYEYISNTSEDIFICIPTQSEVTSSLMYISSACGDKFENVVIAEGYLSFILGIISIIGELLFITSGLIRPESKWICQLYGVLLHYLFLAAFFWMNVMSFDVFKTFANKCILTRVRGVKKYFPRYALYAWGSPAVIVACCCIIDFTHIFENIRIGYGASSLHDDLNTTSNDNTSSEIVPVYSGKSLGCWIKEPVAALVAFGLPILLILSSNAVMFTKTIICIRKTSKMVKLKTRRSSRSSLNHMTGRDDVILYVRMSTMMGFTWTLGLASSIVSAFAGTPTEVVCIILHTLGILFVAFNCSQGLFIFFAFVFNKRVGGFYKDFFKELKRKNSENQIPSTRSSSTLSTAVSISSTLDRL
ncbi:hypothetical protein FSP39_020107 [Pinctada imbricata]|uniref:G-protein coupled receptors family 2 profile 2 domain-containing protein n=1 Tax=Pinctada imbricata TaxID=66713 RepID=A0AA88YRD5_PINIB|nr:hypothetical protein FSP39_020107 [Pinctada imbricata]